MSRKKVRIIIVILLLFRVDIAFSQWQIINSGVIDNLVDGCFISDSTGFIIGENGTILKTTDAGNSWSVNATVTGLFTSICHVGLDTLYVGGNCIYRSDNGGTSWNLIATLPDTITDLGFFDSQTGFSIVPGYTYCTSFGGTYEYDNFKVFKTNNFGSSWQQNFDLVESNSHFQFLNDSTAYVTGGEISIVFHCLGPWQNRSKRTNDRGNTWFPVAQSNYGHSYFSFINDSTGYFVLSGPSFNIDKTEDGGNTLTHYYTEIYDTTIKQCKFLNEIDGYLLGRNNIYVSGSNGLSWNSDFVTANTFNFLFNNTTNILFGIGTSGLIVKKEIIPSAYPDSLFRVSTDKDSLNYGFVFVDSLSKKTLKITNTGNVPLNLSLTTSNNFGISFTSGSFVNNLNVSLSTAQDTIIYIQFNPLLVQNYKDSLTITADSLNTMKVPLEGNGFSGLMGTILHDTLICVDTLRIGSDITISSSARVTICAGTYVKIMGNFKVTVEGILEALGDSNNIIRFAVNDTVALWGGIYMYNPSPGDTSIFNYCNFIVNCNDPLIDIWKGIVSIDHCNFSNSKIGAGAINMYKISDPCKLFISNSNIYNTKSIVIDCGYCDSSYIENNNIYGNISGIQFVTGYGIFITGNNIHDNIHEGIFGNGKMVIQKNKIYSNGGGIYFGGTGPIIENNEIYNNISSVVGGIYNGGGLGDGGGSISQNLIFNNETTFGDGAGIALVTNNTLNLPTLITNNIICNNKAFRKGNNFYAMTGNSLGIDLKLQNNIIYNISDTNNNIIWSHNKGLEIQYNCINQDSINIWGQNNIGNKPHFVQPTDSIGKMNNIGTYDWSLTESSHCLNSGDSIDTSFLLPYDFEGNLRIYNNRVDIGAFEFQGDFVPEIDTSGNGGDTTEYPTDTIYALSLFPNPINDILTITVNSGNLCEVKLYDAASRLIFRKEFDETTSINMHVFSKGIYIYEISDKNGLIKKGKLVKY